MNYPNNATGATFLPSRVCLIFKCRRSDAQEKTPFIPAEAGIQEPGSPPSRGRAEESVWRPTAGPVRFSCARDEDPPPKIFYGRSEPPGRSGIDAVERALGPSEFVRPSTLSPALGGVFLRRARGGRLCKGSLVVGRVRRRREPDTRAGVCRRHDVWPGSRSGEVSFLLSSVIIAVRGRPF